MVMANAAFLLVFQTIYFEKYTNEEQLNDLNPNTFHRIRILGCNFQCPKAVVYWIHFRYRDPRWQMRVRENNTKGDIGHTLKRLNINRVRCVYRRITSIWIAVTNNQNWFECINEKIRFYFNVGNRNGNRNYIPFLYMKRSMREERKEIHRKYLRNKMHLFAREMKKMYDQWSNVNNEPLMRAYDTNCVCSQRFIGRS